MSINPELLEEYINELGINYKTNSLSYIFECPRCHKDVLYMYRSNSCYFTCQKCKFKGSPEYALAELANVSLSIIKERLYGTQWVDTTQQIDLKIFDFITDEDEIDIELFEIIPEIKWKFDEIKINEKHAIRGLRYLESRGVPLDIALKYQIRYAPVRQRILFPVIVNGRLLGHQDRLIVENRVWNEELEEYKEGAKVVSSDNLPNSRVPLFADNLIDSEHAIIAEGPFDGLKFSQIGGNIATMGKAVSKGQISFIRSKGVKRIYLALDRNAYNETNKLIQEFSDLETYVIKVPDHRQDFGDCTFEECAQAFKTASRTFPGMLLLHFE
jgi:hypothetical protein